jgi:hypothetical protein
MRDHASTSNWVLRNRELSIPVQPRVMNPVGELSIDLLRSAIEVGASLAPILTGQCYSYVSVKYGANFYQIAAWVD